MVSLKQFLELSGLQEQLQRRLAEEISQPDDITSLKVKALITSFIQASLENYIVQVYVAGMDLETPEDLQEAIREITFHLSPESKKQIIENCSDEEAYNLGRTFYNLSKDQLPC